MLATDGVHGLVTTKAIAQAASSDDVAAGARSLVNLAITAGGHDNATVISLRVGSIFGGT